MTFRPNPAGIEAVLNGPAARAALNDTGRKIADSAKQLTPRGVLPTDRRRHVADMFSLIPAGKRDGTLRATVTNRHFAAHLVEFGSVNNPAYAPLRRAALALGLKIRSGQ